MRCLRVRDVPMRSTMMRDIAACKDSGRGLPCTWALLVGTRCAELYLRHQSCRIPVACVRMNKSSGKLSVSVNPLNMNLRTGLHADKRVPGAQFRAAPSSRGNFIRAGPDAARSFRTCQLSATSGTAKRTLRCVNRWEDAGAKPRLGINPPRQEGWWPPGHRDRPDPPPVSIEPVRDLPNAHLWGPGRVRTMYTTPTRMNCEPHERP